MNKTYLQIKEKMAELPVEQLAKQTGFQKRKPKKIEALDFATAVLKTIHNGDVTPAKIAAELSLATQRTVSRRAIDNKFSYRHESFAKVLLSEALNHKIGLNQNKDNSLFDFFTDVYLNDSSCVKMAENLFDLFPGPHSSKGKCATARLQLRMNLLSGAYTNLEIQSYRDNDQKYAAELAKQTQAGELNIFDLGYAVLDALGNIDKKEAYYLCRLKFGIHVFTTDGQALNLLKQLKSLYRRGICHLDWEVLIGAKKKLRVRVVAQRVPQRVLEQRLKKASNDRHKNVKHSKEYYEMLAWTIMITNVPKEVWKTSQVLRAYQFRWRIEIVFKCWKSKLYLQDVFKDKEWMRPPAAMMYLYFILIWLILFFVPLLKWFEQAVWNKHQKWLSIFKFADFFNEHLQEVLDTKSKSELIDYVAYYCSYDKRKDRLNYLELLNMF